MRIVAMLLVVLGVGAAALGISRMGTPEDVRVLEARVDSLRTEREKTRKARVEVGIQRRAVEQSLSSIPDSLRVLQTGVAMNRIAELSKRENVFRYREKSQTHAIRRFARRAERLRRQARRRARVPLAAGLGALALGSVLLARTRRASG